CGGVSSRSAGTNSSSGSTFRSGPSAASGSRSILTDSSMSRGVGLSSGITQNHHGAATLKRDGGVGNRFTPTTRDRPGLIGLGPKPAPGDGAAQLAPEGMEA